MKVRENKLKCIEIVLKYKKTEISNDRKKYGSIGIERWNKYQKGWDLNKIEYI